MLTKTPPMVIKTEKIIKPNKGFNRTKNSKRNLKNLRKRDQKRTIKINRKRTRGKTQNLKNKNRTLE